MFPLNPWRLSMDINIGYENIHHYTSIFQGRSYEPHGYKPHPWIYYAQWYRKLFSSCFSSKQFLQTSRNKKIPIPGDAAGPTHHPSMAPSSQEQFKKEFGKEGTTSVPLLEDDAKRVFVQVDQDKSLGSDR